MSDDLRLLLGILEEINQSARWMLANNLSIQPILQGLEETTVSIRENFPENERGLALERCEALRACLQAIDECGIDSQGKPALFNIQSGRLRVLKGSIRQSEEIAQYMLSQGQGVESIEKSLAELATTLGSRENEYDREALEFCNRARERIHQAERESAEQRKAREENKK